MPKKIDILYPYSKGKWKGEILLKDQDLGSVDANTIVELENLAKLLSGFQGMQLPRKATYESIVPFIKRESQTNQTLSIIYSLYKKGNESIVLEDIEKERGALHIAPPTNIHDVLNRLILRGMIMESDPKNEKKAWAITQLGIEFVETKIIKT